jgi:DNA-binding transcriptional regulator YbjK
MLYNWYENRDTVVGNLIIFALTKIDKKDWPKDSTTIDIEFKINGVEVSFPEIIERMTNRYDELIQKRAKAELQEKAENILQNLVDFNEELQSFLKEKAEKLFNG